MSRYSTTTDGQFFVLVQSATAEDLQAKANAVLAQAVADGDVFAFTKLAGAGDGHTFMLWIGVATAGPGTPTGLDPIGLQYFCFLGDNVESVQNQTSAALNVGAGGNIESVTDAEIAGASQGHRFMAVILGGPVS